MSLLSFITAAGSAGAGGAGLDVDEVFKTHVYTGNGSSSSDTQTITNGIDLSGEGGLIWTKYRSGGAISSSSHALIDTERGGNKELSSDLNSTEQTTGATQYFSFNNNGYTINSYYLSNAYTNLNNADFVSWTFRKAPKFFDVQTVTTDSSGNATVNHNLGSSPGFVIVKGLNVTDAWYCFHTDRGVGKFTNLNTTDAESNLTIWNNVSSTTFGLAFGSSSYANKDMVLYLFAHNNGDGGFGPDSDQDVIKCGSYTGDGGTGTTEINLGFEPQWILVKAHSAADNWFVIDNMRGWSSHPNQSNDAYLMPNSSSAESTGGFLDITSTGFKTTLYSNVNVNGRKYIYMAIRRGSLNTPTSATDVFSMDTRGSTGDGNEPAFRSTFPVDFALAKDIDSGTNWTAKTRLLSGKDLNPNTTGAEQTANYNLFDYMNGHFARSNTESDKQSWMWKRAPSYFDVVAYTGNGTAGRTVSHNLGVVPEMIWIKNRDQGAYFWVVGHSALNFTSNEYLRLNDTNAVGTHNVWNSTAPTSSVFSVGSDGYTNAGSDNFIAYLFATVAGVSKVGSFSHTYGSTTNVDCGFSSGARFVLWKRYDGTRHWEVFDTTRGLVSGNDSYLRLSDTSAESTSYDFIDPLSSGFQVGGTLGSGNFIFYAIA